MTIKELSRLYQLNRKIGLLKAEFVKLECCLSNGTNVPGLPHADTNNESYKCSIEQVKADIDASIKQSILEYSKLNKYISDIDDPLVSQIVALRFVNGLSWQGVAWHVGGDNTADGVRKLCYRFLKNK